MSDEAKDGSLTAKEKVDFFKVRIEELDRNFLSHRDLEWRISLQFLSGYFAIAIAHHTLNDKHLLGNFLSSWAFALTLILFGIYIFFSYCLVCRLWHTRDVKNLYTDRLHDLVKEKRESIELKYDLPVPHYYAWATQLLVHFLAVVAILIFLAETTH